MASDQPRDDNPRNDAGNEAIEAAVFRRLLAHLDEHKEVQNIDLMNLAGFCRNCLSKWYLAACEESGVNMDYDRARERVYGMPYGDWKRKFQKQADARQLAAFKTANPSSKTDSSSN